MTSFLTQVARFFVAPADAAARPRAEFTPPRPGDPIAAVLVAEPDLLVAGGAVAAALRREAGAPVGMVCVWRGHADLPLPSPAPRAPGAAQLARKLIRRGLCARACGALCVVELPAEPMTAVAAFRDGFAAADVPAVLALARRDPAFDAVLAGADRLVFGASAGADEALTEMAVAGLLALNPRAERVPLPSAFVVRQAARLGLAPVASRIEAPCEMSGAAVREGLS